MNLQNRQNKTDKPASRSRFIEFSFPLLLAIILGTLFAKSFLPDYVHFSNDGPLGELNTAWVQFPGTLTGTWDDLNDIGNGGGGSTPDISTVSSWLLGPVGFSKFFTPIALFILGLGAWTFFRQLKLSPLAATLGAIATALNSGYFGNACWGTSPQQIAMAMVFFALALVMANSDETPRLIRWVRLALAGMAVGISVMEGADNGAIFSLFVAAYVFYKSIIEEGRTVLEKMGRGVGRVAIIAIFAAFIAAQTISTLIGGFVSGVAGIGEGAAKESPQEHWDWATEWSLPKKETLGIFVPGVFGYRMDTPKDMMNCLTNSYQGGVYWGGMGRTPAIDRFFDSGAKGSPPQGMMRFGYAGYYAGILVALVALFAIIQSFRRQNSIFPPMQQRFIWFWTAALIAALLLAWGRFAPFYHLLYVLPYFSSIRNPAKFTAIFYLAMIIIFAYGIDGLNRCCLMVPGKETAGKTGAERFKSWWAGFQGFNRYWSFFCIVAFVLCVIGFMVYSSDQSVMISYLKKVGYDDDTVAKQIFQFSVGQCGIFLLFFAVAIALMILVLAGAFSGRRAWLASVLLGAFMIADLGRADLPWIIHWDYKQKYASNAVIDILRQQPYEHRVSDIPSDSLFENVYRIEWMQHHFPYYNIQCSDIIQSPRIASDLAAYDIALTPTTADPYLIARKWELTNTRYLFAPANYADPLNQELDPQQHRFQILQRFSIVPKPGIDNPTELEQLTAVTNADGDYALFEFTGALPRAKLYCNWEVETNNNKTLKMLANPNFHPDQTVLVSTPLPNEPAVSTTENSGSVDFQSYAPKDIVFHAQAEKPSVLLLNDRYDAGWRVLVDGKPAELLRCNFIMRGVFLTPGAHTVEFKFSLPHGPLYVTVIVMALGVLLCGVLYFLTHPAAANKNLKNPPGQRDRERRASAGNRKPSSEPVRPASH